MAKIQNEAQYSWAVGRVEELLPLVDDSTPLSDPNSIELELLSHMVADYSDEHFSLVEPLPVMPDRREAYCPKVTMTPLTPSRLPHPVSLRS